MESLTIYQNDLKNILMKFGIMGELLPYVGHYYYWEYLLENLTIATSVFWKSNSQAFKELSKNLKYEIISFDNCVDEAFAEYLKDPQICLNYKINIKIKKGFGSIKIKDQIKIFERFLLYGNINRLHVIFNEFDIIKDIGVANALLNCYIYLYNIGLGQQVLLHRHGKISSILEREKSWFNAKNGIANHGTLEFDVKIGK